MNERLAKLTEQCYEYNETMQSAWFNKTKFAELIVKECAEICLEMATKCAGLPGDGALAKDCAYWIKNDFGVEE